MKKLSNIENKHLHELLGEIKEQSLRNILMMVIKEDKPIEETIKYFRPDYNKTAVELKTLKKNDVFTFNNKKFTVVKKRNETERQDFSIHAKTDNGIVEEFYHDELIVLKEN